MISLTSRFLILLMLALLPLSGCGGSSGSSNSDPLQKNPGGGGDPPQGNAQNYTLSVQPSSNSALTNEEQIVTATLRDATGKPVANKTIFFTIAAGPATAVTSSMRTDSNGVALGFVRTGTTTATTNVIVQGTATLGGSYITGYGNFQVSPGDANLTSTKLSLAASSFCVKPNEQLVVTATVKDSSGNALANQVVELVVTAGPAAMLTTTALTDSNGTAVALVQAGNPAALSNVIVQAKTTVNSNEVTAVIPFQIATTTTSVQSYSMSMTASKQTVDNNEEFYVTALLTDSAGNPVITTPVTFSVASDQAKITKTTTTTDSTGKAIGTVRAGNPPFTTSIIIEASATIASGTVVTALVPVQITTKQFSESILHMTLNSDKTTAGISSDVIMTATISDMQSPPKPIQNQPITFTVVGGPATVVDATVTCDSTGKAVSRLKIGTTNSSSSVIVRASTTLNDIEVAAYSTIQVVRQNSYVINFLTTKTPTDPDGTLNTMSYTIDDPNASGYYIFKQVVPFQVLDNNGIPKPNVDVTIQLSNYGRNRDSIIELVPPLPGAPVYDKITVRTDDHGMGIFLCNVWLMAPGAGGVNTESIVYSATATVSPENISLLSYGGFIVTMKQAPAPAATKKARR